MKARLVRIGNSHGVRIPKPLIEETGLGEELELSVENGSIVIKPARRPRAGWEDCFREMARRGEDAVLDPETVSSSTWDEDQWQWP